MTNIQTDDELVDIVDENDIIIKSLNKRDAVSDPKLIHRAVSFIVFNNKKQVLLQLRSKTMSSDPWVWRYTASGHVRSGENPSDAAERELFEELGLKAKPIFFKKVLKTFVTEKNVAVPRFFWVYYSVVDGEPAITIDKSEVADARWVNVSDLVEFSKVNKYYLNDFSHEVIMEISNKLKLI